MYEIFGRNREDGPVNGAEFLRDFLHPDFHDAYRDAVRRTLQHGDPFRFEGLMYRTDKALRHIEINGNLQPETAASKGRILGTIRDVTEMRKAEAGVRESAKRLSELAAIVASSDDVILSKDLDGIITSWNDAATRVFGYNADEMIGASILKLIPEHLHSDEKTIIENIRAGRRVEHFETVRLTKRGELIDVSRHRLARQGRAGSSDRGLKNSPRHIHSQAYGAIPAASRKDRGHWAHGCDHCA